MLRQCDTVVITRESVAVGAAASEQMKRSLLRVETSGAQRDSVRRVETVNTAKRGDIVRREQETMKRRKHDEKLGSVRLSIRSVRRSASQKRTELFR